ncbi:hypothetical protein Dimus_019125 [Dionaea muscipula]
MVKEDEAAKLNDAEEPANTSHLSVPSPGDAAPAGDQTAVLENALSSLPPAALKDLLSDGVCLRCILRFFSRYGTGNSLPYVVFVGGQMFSNLPGQNEELSKDRGSNGSQPCEGTLNEPDFCCICCGILQLRYIDGNRSLVKHESYNDFAASISKLVKQEGHEADCFTLEVSIPSFIVESEEEARLWMEKKYGSEAWFSKNLQHEVISIKDALKISITNILEKLLGIKCGLSSFRVRLAYTCLEATTKKEKITEKIQASKRRKTGSVINTEAVHDSFSNKEHNLTMIGGGLSMDSNNPQDVSESCTVLEGKVSPCSLEVHSYRLPVFIGGRYLKYSRNVSQTRWIIDEERKGEASVEEIVGDTILPICQGDNYKFHAAGREDIDVRMLGSGRPFLVELQNARVVLSMTLLKDMEEKINSSDNKLVNPTYH